MKNKYLEILSKLYGTGSSMKFAHELSPETITFVLNKLGNPQHSYPTIHVAGTNGKLFLSLFCFFFFFCQWKKKFFFAPSFFLFFCSQQKFRGRKKLSLFFSSNTGSTRNVAFFRNVLFENCMTPLVFQLSD